MALGVLDREAGACCRGLDVDGAVLAGGSLLHELGHGLGGVALVEPHWIVGLAGDFFGADEVAKAGNGNVEFVAVGKFAGRKLG